MKQFPVSLRKHPKNCFLGFVFNTYKNGDKETKFLVGGDTYTLDMETRIVVIPLEVT